jgi:hypothetical protein
MVEGGSIAGAVLEGVTIVPIDVNWTETMDKSASDANMILSTWTSPLWRLEKESGMARNSYRNSKEDCEGNRVPHCVVVPFSKYRFLYNSGTGGVKACPHIPTRTGFLRYSPDFWGLGNIVT